jgi:hypothetical protein
MKTISILQRLAVIMSLTAFSAAVSATNLTLKSLSDDDMDKVVGDFSANIMHTSVSGASPLGHIFGFEVGVLGGLGTIPHIEDKVHETVPGAKADKMAHGGLLGVLSVPLGITAEVSLLPKMGSKDFKAAVTSLAAKWTPTELFLDWPFSLAIKGSQTIATLDFKQDINGTMTTYKLKDSVTVVQALVSKSFIIVEPYAGFGVVSASGDLDASGSSGVFDAGVNGKGKKTGTMFSVGAELKLLILKLGAEYSSALGASRYTGKLSFYF